MKALLSLGVIALLLSSCNQEAHQEEIDKMVNEKVEAKLKELESKPTKTEQQNLEAIGKLLEGFKTGSTDQINELVHDDFVNHNAPEGVQNKEGFKQIVKQVHGIFSSFDKLDLKPEQMFAKGNMVAMMDTGIGERNGKTYTHMDIHIFEMKDGKMFKHWNSFGLPSQRDLLIKFMEESSK